VTNAEEVNDGTDPFDICDFELPQDTIPSEEWDEGDCDNDGLSNGDEVAIGTDPHDPDTDGDGVLDGTEVDDGTDPLDLCDYLADHQTEVPSEAWELADCDQDGLNNGDEVDWGTDPQDPDTDGDGVLDGTEVDDGTDPLDPCDLVIAHQNNPSDDWLEADCDADGIDNGDELPEDTDGDGDYNFNDPDDDDDGIPTDEEDTNLDGDWTNDDCDEDGIPNYLDVDSCDIIPDAFSPNDDGANDVWVIPGVEAYPDFKLEIYDRWGNLVYEYQDDGNPDTEPVWWDGFAHDGRLNFQDGEMLPSGTYFYIIYYNEGTKSPKSGWVFLNR